MPHFIIECSENVLAQTGAGALIDTVYAAAEASGLFSEGDIKVRVKAYSDFKLGAGKNGFLHVFAWIMEGRDAEQKAALSRSVIASLNGLLPGLSILSMNVEDFKKAGYFNKSAL